MQEAHGCVLDLCDGITSLKGHVEESWRNGLTRCIALGAFLYINKKVYNSGSFHVVIL